MDLNEIRQIIEIDGGKFIIVENGKPIMVVTSFEEYKKRLIAQKDNPLKNPTVRPLFSHSTQEQKAVLTGKQVIPKELQDEELKLEDLPI